MSFKRDGDDKSLLRDLQKRRISDLLIDHIPVGEAKLLSNGKYACSICSYKPVFDTVEMLTNHRRGKKHAQFFARHLVKLKNLESAAKRASQSDSTLVAKKVLGATNTLRKLKPYNSCSRKHVIDIRDEKTIAKTENTFGRTESQPARESSGVARNVVKNYLKKSRRTKNFIDVAAKCKKSYPSIPAVASLSRVQDTTQSCPIDNTPRLETRNEDDKARGEYYGRLRQSGWKKDWTTGEWIKDEDAEFDTDEEIPDDSHFT